MAKEQREGEAQAEVKFKGSPEQVQDFVQKKGDIANGGKQEEDFFNLLQASSTDLQVMVDRISPDKFKGRNCLGIVEKFCPPVSFEEIQDRVRDTHKGGRYRARVTKNGRYMAQRAFEVPGDPKLPPQDDDDDDIVPSNRPMFPGQYGGGYGPGFGARGFGAGIDLQRDPEILEAKKKMELLRLDAERKKLEMQLNPPPPVQGGEDKLEKVLREQNAAWEKRLQDMKDTYEKQNQALQAQMERDRQQGQVDRLRSEMTTLIKGLEEKLTQDGGPRGQGGAVKELRDVFEKQITKVQQDLDASIKAMQANKDRDKFEQLLKEKDEDKKDMQRRHDDAMKEMRRDSEQKIEKMTTNGQGGGHLKDYADIMKDVFKSSGERDKVLMAEMFGLWKTQMNATANKNAGLGPDGEPISEVDRFAQFLEVLGMARDVMGGKDQQDEPKDFGVAFLEVVKEAIPQIVDAAKSKEGNVTREEVEQIMKHNLDIAQRRVAQKMQQNPPKRGGLEDTIPQADQKQNAAPQPVAAPTDPDAERKRRVTILVNGIARELPQRPRNCRWLTYAFDELPEETLDALAVCQSVEEFLAIVKPDCQNPATVTFLEQQLAETDKASGRKLKHQWFGETIEILRKEYAKMKLEDAQEEQAVAGGAPVPSIMTQDGPVGPPPDASTHMKQPTI